MIKLHTDLPFCLCRQKSPPSCRRPTEKLALWTSFACSSILHPVSDAARRTKITSQPSYGGGTTCLAHRVDSYDGKLVVRLAGFGYKLLGMLIIPENKQTDTQ